MYVYKPMRCNKNSTERAIAPVCCKDVALDQNEHMLFTLLGLTYLERAFLEITMYGDGRRGPFLIQL